MRFSREPAVWLGAIGTVLTALAALNLPFLNAGEAAAIVSFLTAASVAAFTRPIGPAVFVAVVAPLAALFAEYGLHWSDAAIGGVTALILAAFALVGVRPQVSPSTAGGVIVAGEAISGATVAR